MSRIREINKRLSMLQLCKKHVVYFITEDRDILEEMFVGTSSTLRALAAGNPAMNSCFADGREFYRFVTTNSILVDAYKGREAQFMGNISPFFKEKEEARTSFFYLKDFHVFHGDIIAHFLKQFLNFAQDREEKGIPIYLFLVGAKLVIPDGFSQEIDIIDVPEMDEDDIKDLLLQEGLKECYPGSQKGTDQLNAVDEQRIIQAAADFKGLSHREIVEILEWMRSAHGSFFGRSGKPDGQMENLERIKQDRQEKVAKRKEKNASHDNTITLLESSESVTGLDGYIDWLDQVKDDMLKPEKSKAWGIKPPKGVILSGLPGCGKTQAAKLTAYQMGEIPLVQFRIDNLLGGLVGDSEANFKRCRKRIEALAPCVVLIDELEKIFGEDEKGGGSHEVKLNLLAGMLDWLQENKKEIFFFATSNKVKGLRPELLRDGRFDMRYYVFMPAHDELVDIFEYHMKKANQLAGGHLFRFPEAEYRKLAHEFLDVIADKCREMKKDMFYTGANVESLIAFTNRQLRKEKNGADPQKIPYDDYIDALVKMALSGKSQPYGITNMRDIASSWLEARQNKYAFAGKSGMFDFDWFEQGSFDGNKEEEPRFKKKPGTGYKYDLIMFERISREICDLQKRINRAKTK